MKTKTRMIESKGRGGESWDGVSKFPIVLLVVESTSMYRDIWVFFALDWTSCDRSVSSETARVGDGVGISFTSPCGTGGPRFGAALTYWPPWVERKSSSLFTDCVSIQSGYAAKRSVSLS